MRRSLLCLICWFFLFPYLITTSSYCEVSSIRIVEANPRPPLIYTYVEVLDTQDNLVQGIQQEQISATLSSEFLEIQQFERLSNSSTSVSYVLLIDISRSIPQEKFNEIKSVFNLWISSINPQDQVAVFTFGEDINLIQDFTSNNNQLNEVINSITLTDRYTRLYGAMISGIEYARSLEQNTNTHCVLVILSDGQNDVVGGRTRNEVVSQINRNQIPIYALGVFAPPLTYAEDQSLKNFGELSRLSGGSFFSNANQSFSSIFQSMNERIRNVYRIVLDSPDALVDGNLYRLQMNLENNGKVFSDAVDVRLYPVRAQAVAIEPTAIPTQTPIQEDLLINEPENNQQNSTMINEQNLGGEGLDTWQLITIFITIAVIGCIALILLFLRSKKTTDEQPQTMASLQETSENDEDTQREPMAEFSHHEPDIEPDLVVSATTDNQMNDDAQTEDQPEQEHPITPPANIESPGLYALENVDFSWTVNLDQIWEDTNYDVENINSEIRHTLTHQIERLTNHTESKSPLGWIVVGEGGAGKSHLLRELRKNASSRNVGFIAVDLVGVRDFWDTVLLAYLNSLQKPYKGREPQYQLIIKNLLQISGSSKDQKQYVEKLADLNQEEIVQEIQQLLNLLNKSYKMEVAQYHDVIRALILFNSNDFAVSNIGFSWLQGLGIEESYKKEFGFHSIQKDPIDIVRALSWLMNLRGPSVLVLDQMDAIVHKYHLASGIKSKKPLTDEQLRARSIIHSVAGGLADLVDSVTYRTMIIVSCLEATWRILFEETLSTYKGRFHLPPLTLKSLQNTEASYQLVKNRLQDAYEKSGFIPPYPTWPYSPAAFDTAKHMFPRELLIKCEEHRIHCVQSQSVEELDKFSTTARVAQTASDDPQLMHIDQLFAQERQDASIEGWMDEDLDDKEDMKLGLLLKTMCECLLEENPMPDSIDSEIEVDFPESKSFPPLHVRIRLIFRKEGDQEKQLNFRALLRTSPIAFQNRIQAAMTSSGIDQELPFRKLVIVTQEIERTGQKTTELIQKLKDTGSDLTVPGEEDLRTLIALKTMNKQKPEAWDQWLRNRKPASNLEFINQWVEWLFADLPAEDQEDAINQDLMAVSESSPADASDGDMNYLRIGSVTNEAGYDEPLLISSGLLADHIAILSGSGTNKPILLKRIIEQACLFNIPSIVIDHDNLMAQLDDRREGLPEEWDDSEKKLAEKYYDMKSISIWTPGVEEGNPIYLNNFPDFGVARNNPDKLNTAIELARTSIEANLLSSQLNQTKIRILSNSLQNYAQNRNNGLLGFIDYLSDLPEEAQKGINREVDYAREMADHLNEKVQSENWLAKHTFDAINLLGNQERQDKTNISVLNLNGFTSVNHQQDFVNQLIISLFSSCLKKQIKDHTHSEQSLRGLLIIDDAKNFVPSRYDIHCKSSMTQFIKQAKSLGIGVVFATQEPRSVDLELINECKTHFYGRVNSPASETLIRENMEERWQDYREIARLDSNQFYFYSDEQSEPKQFDISPCYSNHQNTMSIEQIISKSNQIANSME